MADDQAIFMAFKDIAKEKTFQDVSIEDIPIRARKPSSMKRMKTKQTEPISVRDKGFKFFTHPPGFKPRPPTSKKQQSTDEDDMEVPGSPETMA